jgi:CRISPR-associated protein Csb3
MNYPKPNITVNVDVTNPGQFFACCGLLELADRLWPGAEGSFTGDGGTFNIAGDGTLPRLVEAIATAKLIHVHENDLYSSPLIIAEPFRPLSIDWWETDRRAQET